MEPKDQENWTLVTSWTGPLSPAIGAIVGAGYGETEPPHGAASVVQSLPPARKCVGTSTFLRPYLLKVHTYMHTLLLNKMSRSDSSLRKPFMIPSCPPLA